MPSSFSMQRSFHFAICQLFKSLSVPFETVKGTFWPSAKAMQLQERILCSCVHFLKFTFVFFGTSVWCGIYVCSLFLIKADSNYVEKNMHKFPVKVTDLKLEPSQVMTIAVEQWTPQIKQIDGNTMHNNIFFLPFCC